jgi:quercetin dioxygenase-like cupin family protein
MPLEVWDFRHDLKNVFIAPEIRARFMPLPAGTVTSSHTHDLGHEVFLVLDGRIEFTVGVDQAILTPGQMCIARRDEPHTLRVLDDRPATIYLSVTPHVAPTHTFWDDAGSKLPWRYETVRDGWTPAPATAELVDEHLAAVRAFAAAAAACGQAHEQSAPRLRSALAAGDAAAARAAVDDAWERLRAAYLALARLTESWNELAPRATAPGLDQGGENPRPATGT